MRIAFSLSKSLEVVKILRIQQTHRFLGYRSGEILTEKTESEEEEDEISGRARDFST
jgi:hypothetical protein